jgi:hypothetical protein
MMVLGLTFLRETLGDTGVSQEEAEREEQRDIELEADN